MSDVMNPDGTHKVIYDKDAPIPFYQYRIAKLEAEVTELREAAQAVVDRYPTLVTYRTNPLHALAALLEVEK